MKKFLILYTLIILILTIFLSGCIEINNQVSSDEIKLIGTWINSTYYEGFPITSAYSFLSDKSFEINITYTTQYNRINGTWKINNNKINLSYEGVFTAFEYEFSNNEKQLTIIDKTGNIIDLKKQ